MDSVDYKILACLRRNSRMNASAIGAEINMSVSAVIERIHKMEQSGIIKQYTVLLDTQRLGKDLVAFIQISLEHPKFGGEFVDFVKGEPHIAECHVITGSSDYLLKVTVDSTASLESVLNLVKSAPGVSHTHTYVVLSTVKDAYYTDLS